MSQLPTILILDDERPQLLTLRAQLANLGKIADFEDPLAALQFSRTHTCDVAIVDIRMPHAPFDGVEFTRRLREIDRHVSVIFRTADESQEIADHAIDLRASKRAIKSRTGLREMRAIVTAAIQDTADRRRQFKDASESAEAKLIAAEALGLKDASIISSEHYQSWFHSVRNDITTLYALAEQLQVEAEQRKDERLQKLAMMNLKAATKLVAHVNSSLDDQAIGSVCRMGEILGSLQHLVDSIGEVAESNVTVRVSQPLVDDFVSCPPQRLLNALRNVVGFAIKAAGQGGKVGVHGTLAPHAKELAAPAPANEIHVLDSFYAEQAFAVFDIRWNGTTTLEALQQAFADELHVTDRASLWVAARFLLSERGAVMARIDDASVVLRCFVPVSQ